MEARLFAVVRAEPGVAALSRAHPSGGCSFGWASSISRFVCGDLLQVRQCDPPICLIDFSTTISLLVDGKVKRGVDRTFGAGFFAGTLDLPAG